MKKSTERWMTFIGLLILGFNVLGVTAILISNAVHKHRYHLDLLTTGDIGLQFVGPENVELRDPQARVRKDGLVVSGCVNTTSQSRAPVTDEVDVSVLSPQGAVLHVTAIRELSPCKLGGVHFKTKFASIPPDGSILDIRTLAHGIDDATPDSPADEPGG